MTGGVPGGMGQAIWPGDRAALMALPVLMLLTLPLLTWALAAVTMRGSGGSCMGREERTVPGDSMPFVGETGETGDGVNAPVLAPEPLVKTETRLLSRVAAAAGWCKWPVWPMGG
jgi:hypothetical protein